MSMDIQKQVALAKAAHAALQSAAVSEGKAVASWEALSAVEQHLLITLARQASMAPAAPVETVHSEWCKEWKAWSAGPFDPSKFKHPDFAAYDALTSEQKKSVLLVVNVAKSLA